MPGTIYPSPGENNIVNTSGIQTITGPKTFLAGSITSVPIVLKAITGQTSNIFEVKNTSNVNLFNITPSGSLQLLTANVQHKIGPGTQSAGTAVLFIPLANPSSNGLVIAGAPSHTSDLQQWQNSAGTVIGAVGAGGNASFGGNMFVAQDTTFQGRTNAGLLIGNDCWIGDRNIANAIVVSGATDPAAVSIYLGAAGGTNAAITGGTTVLHGNAINASLTLQSNSNASGTVTVLGTTVLQHNVANDGALNLQIYNGSSGATGTQWSGWMRIRGDAVRHGDITWHPVENYWRFRATGAANLDQFSGIYAAAFTVASTEASKTGIETLNVSATSWSTPMVRGAQPTPISLGSQSIIERARKARAVSFLPKGKDMAGTRQGANGLLSFVAEEIAEVLPEIVTVDGNGDPAGINVSSLATITFSLVQNLLERIESLETQLQEKK